MRLAVTQGRGTKKTADISPVPLSFINGHGVGSDVMMEDSDVANERRRLNSMRREELSKSDPLVLVNLNKVGLLLSRCVGTVLSPLWRAWLYRLVSLQLEAGSAATCIVCIGSAATCTVCIRSAATCTVCIRSAATCTEYMSSCSDMHSVYRVCSDMHSVYQVCSNMHSVYRVCSDMHRVYVVLQQHAQRMSSCSNMHSVCQA